MPNPDTINQSSDKEASDSELVALRLRVAERLATSLIAEPSFPNEEDLPRVAPVPFHHVEHQLLVDYDHAADVLWTVALKIRTLAQEAARREQRGKVVAAIVASAFSLAVATLIIWASRTGSNLLLWVVPFVGFGIYARLVPFLQGMAAEELATEVFRERQASVGKLLASSRSSAKRMRAWKVPPELENRPRTHYGDGLLSDRRVLVFLTSGSERMFPGIGTRQIDTQFLCEAKDAIRTSRPDMDELIVSMHRTLSGLIEEQGIPNARCGLALAIDPESLSRVSPWLDRSQRPRLFLDGDFVSSNAPTELLAMDRSVSARLFVGLQVIFPEDTTCLSLFVRPIMAASGVSMAVSLFTLGPPKRDLGYLETFAVRDRGESVPSRSPLKSNEERTSLGEHLKTCRQWLLKDRKEDRLLDIESICQLAPFPKRALKAELEEAERLATLRPTRWSGRYVRLANWREAQSLSMIDDLFTTAECVARIRMIYGLAVQRLLLELEKLGYDISDYHNADGQWTIRADRIDQMIVGEQISVRTGSKENKEAVSEGSQGDHTSGRPNRSSEERSAPGSPV